MYETFAFEDLAESDEWYEADERARRRPPPPRPAPKPPVYTPPSPTAAAAATKAELQQVSTKLDAAITRIEGRVRTSEVEQEKARAVLRRELVTRKTVTDGLRKGLDESRQIAMLLPLLSSKTTQKVRNEDGDLVDAVVDDGDMFSKLLPVLLLSGGFGGGSQTGAGGGMFGGDNSFAMLAMLVAFSGGGKS